MSRKMAINNLKTVSSADRITVTGKVAQNAQRFAINLGQNDLNYLINFNPRFDQHVIVCNSKIDGVWGEEMSFSKLPFRKGEEVTISFVFDGKQVRVHCPDEIVFTSKLSLNHIQYISVDGDLESPTINLA